MGVPQMVARLVVAVLFAMLAFNVPVHAVEPDEMLPDTAMEARARAISAGLRCLVCQNQSIDDSNAPLAKDLRVLVRERLRAGDSDAAVTEFVVARYGQYVLLKPPFNTGTLLLWFGPLVMLLGAGVLLRNLFRQRPRVETLGAELTAEEQRQLDRLMKRDGG